MHYPAKVTKLISKKLILLIISFCFVIVLACLYMVYSTHNHRQLTQSENIIMDYTIYPSTIPQHQLLRIDEAKTLYKSAFDDQVFYGVRDPDSLVTLIKHAWQWDKNAMLYYYRILRCKDLYDEDGKDEWITMSFDTFMRKYRHQLVDSAGNPLVEPIVFKNQEMRNYLSEQFADLKYPYFAYRKSWWYSPCGYDTKGILLPCPDDKLEKSIEYLNYALEGGYHCYEDLIARMLFQQGDHYKDKNYEKLNKLTEYRQSLTLEELKLSIDYAQLMAEHSSIIGILRVTEAYLYGLGREPDPVKAYAWSLLSDYAKQTIEDNGNNLAWYAHRLPPVWEYNKQIQTGLEKRLNPTQKQAAQEYLSVLKTTIVSWSYNRWQDQIDDFHPRP